MEFRRLRKHSPEEERQIHAGLVHRAGVALGLAGCTRLEEGDARLESRKRQAGILEAALARHRTVGEPALEAELYSRAREMCQALQPVHGDGRGEVLERNALLLAREGQPHRARGVGLPRPAVAGVAGAPLAVDADDGAPALGALQVAVERKLVEGRRLSAVSQEGALGA